jgi:Flp pilus assembly protein TadD
MRVRIEAAVEHLRRGDLERAESFLRAILAARPRDAEALHLLGCARLQRSRPEEAVRYLERAIEVVPNVARYHESLAEAQWRAGHPERAAAECRLALRLEPTLWRPHNLLGLVALARCDYSEALGHLADALRSEPRSVDALLNVSVVCNRTGSYERAQQCCERALGLAPGHPFAWINLGLALKGLRRLAEARDAFERAGDLPMARFNLGYAWLLEDDLVRGLPLCEARKGLLGIGRGLDRPEWDGAPQPGGTLLVIHEQGLGDTILMSRFFPQLLGRFGQVVALVQKPLARLIATVSPGVRVVTDLAGVEYDQWCATMSLPLRLGIDSVERVPLAPWLQVPGTERPPGPLRAGLNWAGNPSFAYDFVRSTHLASLELLLQVPGVEWCSLHKGHLEHEAEAYGLPQPLREAGDFRDTAVVVRGLDLVVSTETAIPNLSAALGVRTCVLTSPDTDWRWRSWYAGVTVCSQDVPGDWSGPVARALEVIREEVAAREARAA